MAPAFVPSMSLQHRRPSMSLQRPRRPPNLDPGAAIAAAVRDDRLGVALGLLRQHPALGIPEALAEELASKLRVRGLSHRARLVGQRSEQCSETSAIRLLGVDGRVAVAEGLRESVAEALVDVGERVAALASRGKVDDAFALICEVAPQHVGSYALECLVVAAASAGQLKRADDVLQQLFPRYARFPTCKAYVCFVDACGRAGNLRRARSALEAGSFRRLSREEQAKVYSRVVNACVRCNALEQAEHIVEQMQLRDVPRTEDIYTSLLSGCARHRPLQRSFQVLNLMRADGLEPRKVETYNALIEGCARAGRLREALSFFRAIERDRMLQPDLYTYNALLSCYAKAHEPDRAFELLHHMQHESGITPNAKTYNWVVVACARTGDVSRAFEVAETMRRAGIRLNIVTNNNLLEACCNAGRLERAFALVKDLIEKQRVSPNSHTYNTIIRGCGRWGQLDAALRVLTSMRTAGVSPTVVTYSVAVDACARAGGSLALERAFELVDEMQSIGLEPNLVTYNSLIHACARARRADRAFAVTSRMQDARISPDIVTLCSLVDACGRSGCLHMAFDTIRNMPLENPRLRPNVPAYNALLHACFKAQSLDRLVMAFRDMRRLRLQPNVVTYSTLISAYASAGDMNKAVLKLARMRRRGLRPNRVTFTSLIAGYGRLGQVEDAMRILQEARETCGEPDEELYTAAIVASVRGDRQETALKLAEEMSSAGFLVPAVFNRMMIKVGDVERSGSELRDMLHAMEALGIRPQRAAVESLIPAYASEADVEAAFGVLPVMERLGYPPNLRTYKTLIETCAVNDLSRAYQLFSTVRMRVRNGDPRLRTHHWVALYEAMLRALAQHQPKDSVSDMRIPLLEDMIRDCGISTARAVAGRVATCADLQQLTALSSHRDDVPH